LEIDCSRICMHLRTAERREVAASAGRSVALSD